MKRKEVNENRILYSKFVPMYQQKKKKKSKKLGLSLSETIQMGNKKQSSFETYKLIMK